MNPNPRYIALAGEYRSGKDTLAEYLIQMGYKRYAFGDALRESFHKENPTIPFFPKPRAHYQHHGQKKREENGENYWLYITMRKILLENPYLIVITDLRQPNEYEYLRNQTNATIIRITAPVELRKQRAIEAGDEFDESTLYHETELHIRSFDVDFEINNDGTIEDMHKQMDAIMEQLQK